MDKREQAGYEMIGSPPILFGIPLKWYRYSLNFDEPKNMASWHKGYYGLRKKEIKELLNNSSNVSFEKNILKDIKIISPSIKYTNMYSDSIKYVIK